MEAADIKAFLIYGGIGAVCGLLIALFCRRSPQPFMWTAVISLAAAILAALAVIFVGETIHSMTSAGFSLGQALQSGLAAACLFGFVVAFVCGWSAALAGLAFQCILQRSWRRS